MGYEQADPQREVVETGAPDVLNVTLLLCDGLRLRLDAEFENPECKEPSEGICVGLFEEMYAVRRFSLLDDARSWLLHIGL